MAPELHARLHWERAVTRGYRFIRCTRWQWSPGMLTCDGALVVSVTDTRQINEVVYAGQLLRANPANHWIGPGPAPSGWYDSHRATPQTDDAATLGCIEHAVLPAAWAARGYSGDISISVQCVVIDYPDGSQAPGFQCHVRSSASGCWWALWSSQKHEQRVCALLECMEAVSSATRTEAESEAW